MKRDYYEVLGVQRDVDIQQIKRAYRKLAREHHPDVNDGDPQCEEKFKEATEAYEVLCDPEKRSLYDAYGHEGLRRGAGAAGGFGFDGFPGFSDIFENLFGGFGGGAFGSGSPFGGAQSTGPAAGSKRPPSEWRRRSPSRPKAPVPSVRARARPTPRR
jgi:molecular chaperone DnaJ